MARILAHMTMSLDGYIATDTDEVGALFDWYDAGSIELATGNPGIRFHLDEAGADMLRSLMSEIGALICGRRLFDIAGGWDDQHPIGAPVVVVTHTPPVDVERWPRTRFVSNVQDAVAEAGSIAGDRDIAVASANVVGQLLDLDLIDEVAVSLVPVLMGGGKTYFGNLTRGPVMLADPTVVTGTRATHLRYRVRH